MRIIKDDDVKVFTDASGDTLTLLSTVRQRDAQRADEMTNKEAFQSLADMGLSMDDAMKQAREASEEEQAAARERMGKQPKSLAVRRFRLSAVVKAMCVGNQNIGGGAILEAYDNMDAASGAWVDTQVDTVWAAADPGDAEREG